MSVCCKKLVPVLTKLWRQSIKLFLKNQAFSAVVWFGSSPTPLIPPLLSVSSTGYTLEDWDREKMFTGEGVGGAKFSYDGEKTWPSLNHSVLCPWHFFHLSCVQHCAFTIYFLQEENRGAGKPEAQECQPVPAGAGQARQAHQGQGYPGTVPGTLFSDVHARTRIRNPIQLFGSLARI